MQSLHKIYLLYTYQMVAIYRAFLNSIAYIIAYNKFIGSWTDVTSHTLNNNYIYKYTHAHL